MNILPCGVNYLRMWLHCQQHVLRSSERDNEKYPNKIKKTNLPGKTVGNWNDTGV